jgi:hypothetical protein
LSLDKWIKTDKKEKKTENKSEIQNKIKNSSKTKSPSIDSIEDTDSLRSSEESEKKRIKYLLICSKKSCGYQKRLVKKQLTNKDKTCPRCKSAMKIKKS